MIGTAAAREYRPFAPRGKLDFATEVLVLMPGTALEPIAKLALVILNEDEGV